VINAVDEFVLYDDRQYTRRDWRNRNRIKTPSGTRWLTIPVKVKGRYHQRVDETEISEPGWSRSHWDTIRQSYGSAPHFHRYVPLLEELYAVAGRERLLSAVNLRFLEALCGELGITTPLVPSSTYAVEGERSERLVALCRAAGATEYLSGPSARDYLDVGLFERAGIGVSWVDYSGYPEYPQLHGPFEHEVSVLDLLFMVGPEAPRYMKSFAREGVAGGV
jgi:hypothetical protein